VTIALVLVIAMAGIMTFGSFPAFGVPVLDRIADAPSVTYLSEGLQKTGAPNAVTAVLLDFRAYDTLGEVSVLFCSILGALAILRRKARRRCDETEGESDAE